MSDKLIWKWGQPLFRPRIPDLIGWLLTWSTVGSKYGTGYRVSFWIDLKAMRIRWNAWSPYWLKILGTHFPTREAAKRACQLHADRTK